MFIDEISVGYIVEKSAETSSLIIVWIKYNKNNIIDITAYKEVKIKPNIEPILSLFL